MVLLILAIGKSVRVFLLDVSLPPNCGRGDAQSLCSYLPDASLPPYCGRDDARLLRSLHWMPPSRHTAVEVDARSAAFNISASEVQPRDVC